MLSDEQVRQIEELEEELHSGRCVSSLGQIVTMRIEVQRLKKEVDGLLADRAELVAEAERLRADLARLRPAAGVLAGVTREVERILRGEALELHVQHACSVSAGQLRRLADMLHAALADHAALAVAAAGPDRPAPSIEAIAAICEGHWLHDGPDATIAELRGDEPPAGGPAAGEGGGEAEGASEGGRNARNL
jgi:hypothetical protein